MDLLCRNSRWKNYKETYNENILVFEKQNYFENMLCFFLQIKKLLFFFVKKVEKTKSGFLGQKLPETKLKYEAL